MLTMLGMVSVVLAMSVLLLTKCEQVPHGAIVSYRLHDALQGVPLRAV